MTDLAYIVSGVIDTKGTAAVVAHRLAVLDVVSLSAADLETTVVASPGTHDTRPVRYVGTAPSPTHVQTGVVEDGVQGDGWWQTTRIFTDAPLADSVVQAQNTERLAAVTASRTETENARILTSISKVTDANAAEALTLLAKRMGIT